MMAMPITVCNYRLSCQFGNDKKCQKESPALVIEFWSPLFTNNVACVVPIVCEFDAFANDPQCKDNIKDHILLLVLDWNDPNEIQKIIWITGMSNKECSVRKLLGQQWYHVLCW